MTRPLRGEYRVLPSQLASRAQAGVRARLLLGDPGGFDDDMIVNTHVYGILAAYTPTLRLRRADGAYFSTYLESSERVWASARPFGQDRPEGGAV